MASLSLLPGFRFHPTDEELVAYYLRNKVHGRKIELEIILDVDIYKCEPWDLPEKSFLSGRDLEWYFFSPTDRKYPNSSRTNRATAAGYWKSTGKDRKVISDMRPIGMKKTLVFYTGRAPYGSRTNWVMHEYRLDKNECEASAFLQDSYALCRVFKKSEAMPRTGEQCGTSTEIDFSFGMSNLLNKNKLLTVEEQYEEKRSLLSHEQDQTNSLKEASSNIMNDINVDDGALTTTVQLLHYDNGSRSFHPLNESSYPKVLQGEHCKCSCPLLEVGNFPHIKTYPSLSGSRMPNTYLGDQRILSFVEEAKMLEQLYQDVLITQENNNVNRFMNSDAADIV